PAFVERASRNESIEQSWRRPARITMIRNDRFGSDDLFVLQKPLFPRQPKNEILSSRQHFGSDANDCRFDSRDANAAALGSVPRDHGDKIRIAFVFASPCGIHSVFDESPVRYDSNRAEIP